jgi:predicted deacylase
MAAAAKTLYNNPPGLDQIALDPGYPPRTTVNKVYLPFGTFDYGLFKGEEEGLRLLVMATIHGPEHNATETVRRMLRMNHKNIKGTLLVLPILNQTALEQHTPFVVPEDDKNLNRQFPGDPNGTKSQQIADWVTTKIFPYFDYLIDAHSGDLTEVLTPLTVFPKGNQAAQLLATWFGLPYAVESAAETTSIGGANSVGLAGIIAEVGDGGRWSEESVTRMSHGIARVMDNLGMFVKRPAGVGTALSTTEQNLFDWDNEPTAPIVVAPSSSKATKGGFWVPTKQPDDPVTAGEILGRVITLHGQVLQTVEAQAYGVYLYGSAALWVNPDEELCVIGTPVTSLIP